METIREVKQYLIIRQDLQMSIGKTAVQASHAALNTFLEKLRIKTRLPWLNGGENEYGYTIHLKEEEVQWIEGNFTKIVKRCKNEAELLKIYEKAKEAGLNVSLIKDLALTELKEPAYTAVAIGPNYIDKIEPIIKRLQNL